MEEGSATGMVLDFGDVKQILTEHVHDILDHGFIVYERDYDMMHAFGYAVDPEPSYVTDDRGWKIILFPYVPTAENIARWVFDQIKLPINNAYNDMAYLDAVKVWETPSSTAIYTPGPGG
jgi:6-pyruvoyltetrahydropterin/6-carboxytetrahydropterin synthase